MPMLWLRKLWLSRNKNPEEVVRRGYHPPGGQWGNWMLSCLGALEPLPQRLFGTSVMAIYRKETAA